MIEPHRVQAPERGYKWEMAEGRLPGRKSKLKQRKFLLQFNKIELFLLIWTHTNSLGKMISNTF